MFSLDNSCRLLQCEILKRYDIDKQRVEYAVNSENCYKSQKSFDKDVLYIEVDFESPSYLQVEQSHPLLTCTGQCNKVIIGSLPYA